MNQIKVIASALVFATSVAQSELTVEMHKINDKGIGEYVGTVTISKTPWGTLFTPDLTCVRNGLYGSTGLYGFHVHQNPACGPGRENDETKAGLAAGGHWDPENTDRHEGPYGQGHLGDLPPIYLYLNKGTRATHPVLAPQIKDPDQLKGHALMIHEGGDNYSDHPAKLGGGGARIACGVIK